MVFFVEQWEGELVLEFSLWYVFLFCMFVCLSVLQCRGSSPGPVACNTSLIHQATALTLHCPAPDSPKIVISVPQRSFRRKRSAIAHALCVDSENDSLLHESRRMSLGGPQAQVENVPDKLADVCGDPTARKAQARYCPHGPTPGLRNLLLQVSPHPRPVLLLLQAVEGHSWAMTQMWTPKSIASYYYDYFCFLGHTW